MCGEEERVSHMLTKTRGGRLNRYRIQDIVSVTGERPTSLRRGWIMARAENDDSMSQITPLPTAQSSHTVTFYGVSEELHYTSAEQRRELDKRSCPELNPSPRTAAVLIPVKKSAEWWRFTQDERRGYFQRTPASEGHTAIGLRYADRIHRKLYHSRHLLGVSSYDFLTYFEFKDTDAPAFRELVAELRDVARNPEWKYVDSEFELWMTKIA